MTADEKFPRKTLEGIKFLSLEQCFPTRVPRNLGIPRNIVKGSSRNRGIYIENIADLYIKFS
jgi:hypothetical protein